MISRPRYCRARARHLKLRRQESVRDPHSSPSRACVSPAIVHALQMTGMGLVTLKFTLVLFLAYPLALPVRWLPSPALRHAWVGLGGAILAYFTFGSSWLSVLYSSLTAYALLWILNYVPILRNWRHFAAATASFGYLMHRHWQRSSDVTASDIDDVVLHLVVAVKIFTFAFCVYDGSGPGKRALDKKLETLNSKEAGGPEKNGKAIAIVEDRRGRSIATLPNPLQYLGYILNFTTMFVGPAFEYGEYIKSQERADTPPTNRFIPAVWKLVQASAYMGVYAVFAPHYTAEGVYKLASQAPHAFYNFPALLKYSLAAYLLVRMSYYAVWKLAEGAAVIAGFGYRASNKPGRAAPAWEDACWSFTNILGLPLTSIQSIASVLCCGRKDASERALALLGMPLAGVSSSKPDWEGANNVNPISVETSRNIQVGRSVDGVHVWAACCELPSVSIFAPQFIHSCTYLSIPSILLRSRTSCRTGTCKCSRGCSGTSSSGHHGRMRGGSRFSCQPSGTGSSR